VDLQRSVKEEIIPRIKTEREEDKAKS